MERGNRVIGYHDVAFSGTSDGNPAPEFSSDAELVEFVQLIANQNGDDGIIGREGDRVRGTISGEERWIGAVIAIGPTGVHCLSSWLSLSVCDRITIAPMADGVRSTLAEIRNRNCESCTKGCTCPEIFSRLERGFGHLASGAFRISEITCRRGPAGGGSPLACSADFRQGWRQAIEKRGNHGRVRRSTVSSAGRNPKNWPFGHDYLNHVVPDDEIRDQWDALSLEERDFLFSRWREFIAICARQNDVYDSAVELYTDVSQRLQRGGAVRGRFHEAMKSKRDRLLEELTARVESLTPTALYAVVEYVREFGESQPSDTRPEQGCAPTEPSELPIRCSVSES